MPLKVDSLITNTIVLNGTEISGGGTKPEIIFVDMASTTGGRVSIPPNSEYTIPKVFGGDNISSYVNSSIVKLTDGSYQIGRSNFSN
jgi:hypothetical protein